MYAAEYSGPACQSRAQLSCFYRAWRRVHEKVVSVLQSPGELSSASLQGPGSSARLRLRRSRHAEEGGLCSRKCGARHVSRRSRGDNRGSRRTYRAQRRLSGRRSRRWHGSREGSTEGSTKSAKGGGKGDCCRTRQGRRWGCKTVHILYQPGSSSHSMPDRHYKAVENAMREVLAQGKWRGS